MGEHSHGGNTESMDALRGTSQLMNCHQNPRTNPYYYGPVPPMIVTGPSNDMRNMQQYSDSYNDSYGVIYDESMRKNGKYEDMNEEITSSEEEEQSDLYDEDESVENTKDATPELMHYDDEEDDTCSDNEQVQRAQSENDGDVDSLHLMDNIRSKSVPTTPTLSGTSNPKTKSLPLALSPTTDDIKDDKIKTSQTPKANQSYQSVETQKKRSKSQDNADPTSPNLIPQTIDIPSNKSKKEKKRNAKKKKDNLWIMD